MLGIENLHVNIDDKAVLQGINLSVQPGEIHAIMGPNGSGKSTLSKVLAGHPDYEVTRGSMTFEVNFKNEDISQWEPDLRAKEGIFVAFQYPTEVPGVPNAEFLRASFNAVCRHQGTEEMDPLDFDTFLRSKIDLLEIDADFMNRQLNVDYSGGEKKKNEILQMAVLSPRLAILDETDSGLDVDSLKVVADGVNKLKNKDSSMILITHYHRILEYIVPDYVHVLHEGKIIKTGDSKLALEIEKKGYDWLI